MHLNRLSLRNFKKYRRAEIEFLDGLTGIVGGNGAGKSTIVEAVAWALYGSKASTIKRDFIKNARASENDSVEVVLRLRMGSQELTIYRGIKGKSMSPEAALDIDGHRVASGSREVDGRLEEMLKISFQDFMKTFYARQKDLDNLLREGGTGKREYLLKLLGLDEIRERSIDQIKSDLRTLDGQKNRISGALAEIGEVERRIEDHARSVSSAQEELIRSRRIETSLAEKTAMMRRALDIQVEKRRSHDLLSERISRFETSASDKKRIIEAGEIRLREIDELKKLLAELEPKQKRLKVVKTRIEFLEPRRKEHDKLIQRSIRIGVELSAFEQAIQDNEQRLTSLTNERSKLENIAPLEAEYQEVQAAYANLESLRDRHIELRNCIEGERIRQDSIRSNLARTETAKKQLLDAQLRIVQLQPLVDENRALQGELVDLIRQKDLKKELDGLISRRTALKAHSRRLADDKASMQVDLAALGDLEAKEVDLRKRDVELDKLRTYLDSTREDLRGDIKVQESRRDDAKRNLSKVKGLGAEGSCPTCERPLDNQYLHLVEKYEIAASSAEKAIENLKREVQELTDKINGVISSRSSLKKSFDDLNSNKNRRAELVAGLRSLERQGDEAAFESAEISKAVVNLGEVRHDPERLVAVQSRLEKIFPSLEEYRLLAFKLEDLPSREAELESLKAEILKSDQRLMDLGEVIEELGYTESEYLDRKNMLTELRRSHDDFVLLSQRVTEIPVLEDGIRGKRADLERLRHAVTVLEKSLVDLGFDPAEYEGLAKEIGNLSRVEDEAHKINLKVAAEAEIRERLKEAALSLAKIKSDLILGKEQIKALGYSEAQHSAARQDLTEAEGGLEAARKEASNRQVHLGVLEAEMARLRMDAQRKKEFEQELAALNRRLEVVDTTKSLVNRFMDHILVRIRGEIVRIAGEILEEVSGKYSLLKIDDDFNIMVEDGGEYYSISRYSGGEIDMIAVSVRVAISEYLMRFGPEGENYSFIILDEVFGSQDLEHREKMINMLRSLEERFPQIIAISHFSDVQGQFDNTIQVVEDELGNSRVEVV